MADRTATYKGRKYLLKFLGKTKFGRRAKLAFLDGSKEFWVSADLVTEGGEEETPSVGPARRTRGYSARPYSPGCGCSCHAGGGEPCFGCRHDECWDG